MSYNGNSNNKRKVEDSKFIRGNDQQGAPPRYYKCHKCGNSGHWIKNCPLHKEQSGDGYGTGEHKRRKQNSGNSHNATDVGAYENAATLGTADDSVRSCWVCDASFSDEVSLSAHFISTHKSLLPNRRLPMLYSSTRKTYYYKEDICLHCGEKFHKKSHKKFHLLHKHKDVLITDGYQAPQMDSSCIKSSPVANSGSNNSSLGVNSSSNKSSLVASINTPEAESNLEELPQEGPHAKNEKPYKDALQLYMGEVFESREGGKYCRICNIMFTRVDEAILVRHIESSHIPSTSSTDNILFPRPTHRCYLCGVIGHTRQSRTRNNTSKHVHLMTMHSAQLAIHMMKANKGKSNMDKAEPTKQAGTAIKMKEGDLDEWKLTFFEAVNCEAVRCKLCQDHVPSHPKGLRVNHLHAKHSKKIPTKKTVKKYFQNDICRLCNGVGRKGCWRSKAYHLVTEHKNNIKLK